MGDQLKDTSQIIIFQKYELSVLVIVLVFYLKKKVLLGIYIRKISSSSMRLFLSWGRTLLQVETFAEQASSLALISRIDSKCQNPLKISLSNVHKMKNSLEGVDYHKQHFYFFLTSHCCSRVYSIFTFITWEADFDERVIILKYFLRISKERVHVQKCH